jgi:hypothetical protein
MQARILELHHGIGEAALFIGCEAADVLAAFHEAW